MSLLTVKRGDELSKFNWIQIVLICVIFRKSVTSFLLIIFILFIKDMIPFSSLLLSVIITFIITIRCIFSFFLYFLDHFIDHVVLLKFNSIAVDDFMIVSKEFNWILAVNIFNLISEWKKQDAETSSQFFLIISGQIVPENSSFSPES